MALREVVILNESVPQLQAPQAADIYNFVRKAEFTDGLTLSANSTFVISEARFYRDATLGAVLQGWQGGTNNFTWLTPAGQRLLVNPAGTSNLGFLDSTATAGIAIGAAAPVATAQLELVSTTRGFLPPRMTTTQRDAIGSPAEGLTIYNTTTQVLNFFNGSAWGAV